MEIFSLPKEQIGEAAQHVWSLVQITAARCYPLVMSAEDFERTLKWAIEDDSGRAWSCWEGRELLGICCLFVSEEERYVQLLALYAWSEFQLVADAFLNRIDKEYPMDTVDVGIVGENVRLAEMLLRYGFCIVDDCLDLRHQSLSLYNHKCEDEEGPVVLHTGPLGAYAALHDAWFPGLYWNSKRLSEVSDGWTVLASQQDGQISGAILLIFGKDLAEIYGLHAVDVVMARTLLCAALHYCMEKLGESHPLLFMVESMDELSVRAALDCGFTHTGRYIGFRKTPPTDKEK